MFFLPGRAQGHINMTNSTLANPRIKVFLDYWNFQLLANQVVGQDKTPLNWPALGEWLAEESALIAKAKPYNYEGMNIYTSYNPKKDPKYYDWVQKWLNRQPGVQVYCLERRPKQLPRCPSCKTQISTCPSCHASLEGTSEKGVDALLVTDMIRLAWENSYEIAVLASSDSDIVPAVKYLDQKGKKVIHAGFLEIGSNLAKSCWASFDIAPKINQILRPSKK